MLNEISQATLNLRHLAGLYSVVMTIGARIRQLRTQNKLSGEKFGELCGVTKGAISQWESDMTTPPVDKLLDLRQKLDFSFDWLLSGNTNYTTSDPKIIAVAIAMQPQAEYVKDAAVQAVLTNCELAARAKANGAGNGTNG